MFITFSKMASQVFGGLSKGSLYCLHSSLSTCFVSFNNKQQISEPLFSLIFVTFPQDGFTYERVAMEAWLASGKRTSPMTNEKLAHLVLTPNRTLRTLIQKYREDNI